MAQPTTEAYPRGQISIGNGEWQHVTNFKCSYENKGELVFTFGGTGYTTGPRSGEATFDTVIGADGQDLDTLKKIKNAEPLQARFKFPGRTISITGIMTKSDLDFPIDKPIAESVSMVGVVDAT